MDDIRGAVILAQVAVSQFRGGGVASIVGNDNQRRRQHLTRHDFTAETHQPHEGVAVQRHACHHVRQKVTTGTVHVRLGHETADRVQFETGARLVNRQAGYSCLQNLNAAKHGAERQRVMGGRTAWRHDASGHVGQRLVAALHHATGQLQTLPQAQTSIHAAQYARVARHGSSSVPPTAANCRQLPPSTANSN